MSDVVVPARRGHVPVMPAACLRELAVGPGQIVCDCTAGGGGHLERFANAVGEAGRVIALDRDDRAFRDDAAGGVAKRFPQVTLLRHPFSELPLALAAQGLATVTDTLSAASARADVEAAARVARIEERRAVLRWNAAIGER